MHVPDKKIGVENISDEVDLSKLEAEWKEHDPGMDDLKGYGAFVQERVQQTAGIELPAAV